MYRHTVLAVGFIAALGLSSCDKSEEQVTAPETAPAAGERTAVEGLLEKGQQLKAVAAEAAKEAMAAAEEKSALMAEAASEMAETAAGSAAEVADEVAARAEKWIAEARAYASEGREDLAANILARLEGVKASLPESMRAKIDELRSTLGGDSEAAAM